ncbi:MAG: hypothetical protein ACFWTJ_14740 [Lachnoclostridium sp.]|jgi:hypothetical protein
MNMKNMKGFCFFVIMSLLMMANGCSLKPDKQILDNTNINSNQTAEEYVLTDENTDEISESADNTTVNTGTESSEEQTVVPAATKEVSIYTINEDTNGVESVVALVPEDAKITPELIIELVTDSMADNLVEVGIDKVSTQKDTVIVSFKSDQPPITNVESKLEKTILDAIAQSLVDNLKDYPKVIFRVEGKAYKSSNFSFGIDQVYLDNTNTK